MAIWGGIEAGGTKFNCIIGSHPDDVRAETTFPTTTPAVTLNRSIQFFLEHEEHVGPLQGIGIGSFGPVDLDKKSPTFGFITTTPKPGWMQTDFAGTIRRELKLPVKFDTDVNAAAFGEYQWGAAQGLNIFIYLTVGTGIGGGGIINGKLMHGLVHPEMGHIRIPHDLKSDPFPGICPFHNDCFDGLASGPALTKRWGIPANAIAPDHPAWELEAEYLALALINYIFTLSPQRIIMGGGVMNQQQLFPMIRLKVKKLLNDYLKSDVVIGQFDNYIVPPKLGDRVGVLGALALARYDECEERQ